MPSVDWPQTGVWAALIAILTLLGVIARQIVPWKRSTLDAEAVFRADLINRVTRLEKTLDRERSRHNAEISLDRHRLNNVTQCFDALLLLIEMAPDKAMESVQRIKAMRSEQLKREAEEKAIIRAAEIAADNREDKESGEEDTNLPD